MEFDTRPQFHKLRKNDRIVYAERLPHNVIDEVIVNPLAVEMLDNSHKALASTDGIIENTFIMVPPGSGDAAFFSPPRWTRTVTIDSDVYPYGGMIGTVLSGKGCTITGSDYLMKRGTITSTPWGYFGDKDAAKDMYLSNLLLQTGARVALPLGYAVINHEKVKEWLQSRWGNNDRFKFRNTQLNTVIRNGDHMAYYLRIGGSRVRLDSKDNKIVANEMQRIAPFILQESVNNPASLSKESLHFFTKVANQSPLQENDMFGYVAWAASVVTQNMKALYALYRQGHTYDQLGEILASRKDICLGLFHQDFEEVPSLEKKKSYMYPYDDYEYSMKRIVRDHVVKLYTALIGREPLYEEDLQFEHYYKSQIEKLKI
ncbi:MAG: hypothetical protein ACEQSA_04260 [Weeksellaceae bacterium]